MDPLQGIDLRSGVNFLNVFEEQEVIQSSYDKSDELDFVIAILKNNVKAFLEPSTRF